MSERKYRIRCLADGKYQLDVLASDPGDEEHWVAASAACFDTREAAEWGIARLVKQEAWFYDAKGRPA